MDDEIKIILEKVLPTEIVNMIMEIKEEMEYMDEVEEMVTCERCGRVWDGYAQCFPCIDSDSEYESDSGFD